jgi:hypothetical protein
VRKSGKRKKTIHVESPKLFSATGNFTEIDNIATVSTPNRDRRGQLVVIESAAMVGNHPYTHPVTHASARHGGEAELADPADPVPGREAVEQ